jgi:hypothetical protein
MCVYVCVGGVGEAAPTGLSCDHGESSLGTSLPFSVGKYTHQRWPPGWLCQLLLSLPDEDHGEGCNTDPWARPHGGSLGPSSKHLWLGAKLSEGRHSRASLVLQVSLYPGP